MSNTRTTRPRATPARARQTKPAGPSITFLGDSYRVSDKIGVWPLMQFARAAEAGEGMADQKGLAAFHAQMQDVIHPDDWGRFQEDMIAKKVDMGALVDCARQATEVAMEAIKKKQGRTGTNGQAKAEVEG